MPPTYGDLILIFQDAMSVQIFDINLSPKCVICDFIFKLC